ncbi:carbamoyltransferase HypF [Pyrinomonas methylaliphatogenes]|uniref:Carbamoyltransferase n=1 Tax=Pyrinomonas methylaliphatogenes TaxID=454194 RepID=A0A0B6X0I2_9BACT|nr:carbamoyltransferase HypF [Pyrinomonas methylaliphatogenes]CDM67033.1 Hydrogenase maturation protein, carbamoyltransferase HypF [Pyrinomonas methylaliphatogenes]
MALKVQTNQQAVRVRVRGVVQGVGFRPFVYREATRLGLAGWVLNGEQGVEIHLEGEAARIELFLAALEKRPPSAARIAAIETERVQPCGCAGFSIRESEKRDHPTVRVSPDLAICEACLRELFDPRDRRFRYPYINCTDCGPRYSITLGLPYDRPQTTMRAWPLCDDCAREYHDPRDRRFHAQPVACPRCGPRYKLLIGAETIEDAPIAAAARLLRRGGIVAVKGIGGYHLACDALNAAAVQALRERKFRKEKPFALMVRDLDLARRLVELTDDAVRMLVSVARPIVLCPARQVIEGVAPENCDLGIMLPYAPLHHLLFAAGAPPVLVMTSANRSSEPIAYEDEDARDRLAGIADALLIGERPIARRVDDSITRDTVFGPQVLRRARGYAPATVTMLPTKRTILAVGADLKNSITLVVRGQAIVSQHIGDLDHFAARRAFAETIRDLCALYEVDERDLVIAHDAHPQYFSTEYAVGRASTVIPVQHHRAHVASVLAEREAWETRVIGFAFDGTGYGDDGAIWGGEIFAGSLREGFKRVAHLRAASLPGGDAAARWPSQAAAGFLAAFDDAMLSPLSDQLGRRFALALSLARKNVRSFPTTSMGRLFDAVAAVLGFARETSFEAQAAMWLEYTARQSPPVPPYPFPFTGKELDHRPLLANIIADWRRGRPVQEIARAFHASVAHAVAEASLALSAEFGTKTIVLSGGVFQNSLLLEEIAARLDRCASLRIWCNREVPPNDGGISLGQAASAAFQDI